MPGPRCPLGPDQMQGWKLCPSRRMGFTGYLPLLPRPGFPHVVGAPRPGPHLTPFPPCQSLKGSGC